MDNKKSEIMPQEHAVTIMDTKPANVFAYVYVAVGAIVMGAGMSLVMTDIGTLVGLSDTMVPGIVVGVLGLGMALTTYPIHKKILNSRKSKQNFNISLLSYIIEMRNKRRYDHSQSSGTSAR